MLKTTLDATPAAIDPSPSITYQTKTANMVVRATKISPFLSAGAITPQSKTATIASNPAPIADNHFVFRSKGSLVLPNGQSSKSNKNLADILIDTKGATPQIKAYIPKMNATIRMSLYLNSRDILVYSKVKINILFLLLSRYNYLQGNTLFIYTELILNMASAGSLIQTWRKKRRLSQLNLALSAEISSRHLSFIETNRSIPSRAMIFKIHHVLNLPRHALNTILCAAGYLPHYKNLAQSDESLKPIFIAIEKTLSNHMPYPAFVLDVYWNVIRSNQAMNQLLTALNLQGHQNIIEALTDLNFTQSNILNYDEVLAQCLNRLRSEMSLKVDDPILNSLEKKLLHALPDDPILEIDHTVLNTQFNIHGKQLKLFSIIAELSAVQEIAVGEFKIELMFPLDQATEDFFSPPSLNESQTA